LTTQLPQAQRSGAWPLSIDGFKIKKIYRRVAVFTLSFAAMAVAVEVF
jgi:hypothetical protein